MHSIGFYDSSRRDVLAVREAFQWYFSTRWERAALSHRLLAHRRLSRTQPQASIAAKSVDDHVRLADCRNALRYSIERSAKGARLPKDVSCPRLTGFFGKSWLILVVEINWFERFPFEVAAFFCCRKSDRLISCNSIAVEQMNDYYVISTPLNSTQIIIHKIIDIFRFKLFKFLYMQDFVCY